MKSAVLSVIFYLYGLSISCCVFAETPESVVGTIERFYRAYLGSSSFESKDRPSLKYSKSFIDAISIHNEVCVKYVYGICGWASEGDEYLDAQETDPKLNYENSGIKIDEILPNQVRVKLNVYPSENNGDGFYDKVVVYKMIMENGEWVVDDIAYKDGVSSRKIMDDLNKSAIAHPDPEAIAAQKSKDNHK